MKKQKNTNRGITLIALIITIIVLLILAGVALASLFGENGILNNAETAKLKTNHSAVAEGVKLKMSEYQIAKDVDGYSYDFKKYLKEYEDGAILNEDGVINVKNLLGKALSTGNGTGTDDVYKLEENIETAKLASTQGIKISSTSNTVKYILRYYKAEGNYVELEIFSSIAASSSENINLVDCENCNGTGEICEEGNCAYICSVCGKINLNVERYEEEGDCFCSDCGSYDIEIDEADEEYCTNCGSYNLDSDGYVVWFFWDCGCESFDVPEMVPIDCSECNGTGKVKEGHEY